MVQLYGLRSERNWGIGDFSDLRTLVELAARLGAALVGVNPLHAGEGSPYSPSSRHALNWLYLDVEAIPEYAASSKARALVASSAFQKRLARAARSRAGRLRRRAPREARGARAAVRREHVQERRAARRRAHLRAVRGAAREARRRLADLAEAVSGSGFPGGDGVSRKAMRSACEFHAYAAAGARASSSTPCSATRRELGMPIGLYVDLALGADRGGAEVWADQDVLRARRLVRRAARRVQSARPGLGPAAVLAARAARHGLPAVRRRCCAPTCPRAGRCAWTTSWR